MNTERSQGKGRLVVESGVVWATRTGENQDYLIQAGSRLDLVGPGWVIAPLGFRDATRWRIEILETGID